MMACRLHAPSELRDWVQCLFSVAICLRPWGRCLPVCALIPPPLTEGADRFCGEASGLC